MEAPLHKAPIAMQRSVSIFTVIAIFSIIVVGGAYGGLYFYKSTLSVSVANAKKSLNLAESSFEADTISDLQLFDKRIAASKQVLASHIVVSPLFELLNTLTLPSIQFTKFSYSGSTDGKSYSVKMSGNAKDYKSIAVQAGLFNSNAGKYLKDVAFSNLNLSDDKEKKGYVTFDVSFNVDPILLSYEKQLAKYTEEKKAPIVPANDNTDSTLKEFDSILDNNTNQ